MMSKMSEPTTELAGGNVVAARKDKNEECKTNLHRWVCTDSVRTCSLFAGIQVKLAACGEGHLMIVSNNHQVFSVGANEYGQLGLGDRVDRKTPREVIFLTEKLLNRIACGSRHSCAISKSGQVFCWGDSRQGQCGQGEKGIFTTPCRVRFANRSQTVHTDKPGGISSHRFVKAQEIACGDQHTLTVDTQGTLWSWGSGPATGFRQANEEILAPRKIKRMLNKKVVQISCGRFHSIALVQEDLNSGQNSNTDFVFQSVSDDSLETLTRVDSNVAQKVPFLENVFYCDEEDASIDWSMDLQKLSRSNTPPVFENEPLDVDPYSSNLEEVKENEETVEPNDITVQEDVSQELETTSNELKVLNEVAESLEKVLENEGAAGGDNEAREEGDSTGKPRIFDNKLFELADQTSDEENDQGNLRRSRSCSDVEKDKIPISLLAKSVSENESLEVKSQDKGQETANIAVTDTGPNKEIQEEVLPVEISDIKLTAEASRNDLFYSAFDILPKEDSKQEQDQSPKEKSRSSTSATTSTGSSTSIRTSSQSTEMGHTSSKDPLSLSIDKSMEDVILAESCSVVVDDTSTEKSINLESVTKNRTQSAWSIATTGSNYEVDKIGSLQLLGSSNVWAWGENRYGQLGIGDSTLVIHESTDPVCVSSLKGKDVVCIAAGNRHTLALTRDCQVFGWGDNSAGQLGFAENKTLQPQKIAILRNVRVWDVAIGDNFSVFLADSSSNNCSMYQLGENIKDRESEFVSLSHVAGASMNKKKSFKKIRRTLNKAKRELSTDSISADWYVDIDLRRIEHFDKNAILRTVQGSNNQFVCITASEEDQLFKVMYRLASSERYFYYQLSLIQEHLMTPLLKTESWTTVTKLPGGEALMPLTDCFADILLGIGVGVSQLTETIKAGLRVKDLFSYFLSDSFRAGYDRYSKCYCDTLAVGHLHSLSKAVSNIISKAKDPVKEIFLNLALEQADLAALLRIPLTRSSYYAKCVEKLSRIMKDSGESNIEEINQLQEVVQRWQDYSDHTATRLREADKTREFWDECPTKLIEALKDPYRRVLRTSKNAQLSLARASRLTSHSFMLFNDVFVHSQSNRHFLVFPLVTMWVEPLLDTDQQKNALRVTSPEASFVLISESPFGRTEWVKELNEAIAQCLSATSLHRITSQSVNSISGILRAADAREASYTYLNHLRYKGAKYSGMWMSGMPFGRGKTEWPDGMKYEGEFENGNFQGYGIMTYPTGAHEAEQRYEGDWVEGRMRGYGKMTYPDTSEYVGHWENDARNGHGTLRTFSPDGSLQTVYIGGWHNDQKSGYGVQDFVVRGEKYIGMWSNDQRHGYGIVVTVDGVYYEGRFLQNKLAGKGILLSDDDTCYEGEFTADMQLSGKGVLTMPNGDYIEGHFHGNWGEGIKVNGTFNKFANPDPTMSPIGEIGSSQMTVTDFTIPAGIKWKALFEEFKEDVGCSNETLSINAEQDSVWKHIDKSIIKTRSSDIRRRSTRKRDIDKVPVNISDKNKPKDCHDIREMQCHLAKDMDTFGHPLFTLVEGLVDVYRATYVGVGAHRRLLLHAVEEAKSYISRLYNAIRFVFPQLPDEEFVMLSHDRADGVDEHPVNSNSLLHRLILPRLYPPLFTLYALHTEKMDAVYMERLHQLNKRGDIALMSFLGVDRKFLLCKFDEETKEPIIGDKPPYKTSVAELELLSTTYSPMEKIEVIRRSFAKIHEEVNNFWQGEKKIMAMDDLFPVFQYVVTRARIPHLGSEVQFIEDLVDYSDLVGEMGHMVTTLKACYFQIQNEQDRD